MSCLLDEVAIIKDYNEVLPWLCPHLYKKNDVKDWEDELAVSETKTHIASEGDSEEQKNILWLENCHVAISPVMDLMILACRNRLSFFTGRWERISKSVEKDYFTNNWRGLVGHDEGDEVSSILCLPIMSQSQSSSGAPDWTCVVVGFKSGYVSFYTDSGLLILSQIFEENTASRLYCRTYIPESFGACIYSDLTEEFVILYPRSIVTIDGFSLMQTLKACRNQAAKAAASGEECQPKMVSLDYKKFSLSDQEWVSDCVASGMLPPHLYDHIVHEGAIRGFNTSLSSGVPNTTQIMTVGRSPFFGILGIREGTVQPFIADIAMHYASKLKDALFQAATGWLFKGRRQPPEQTKAKPNLPKIEQPLPISFRYLLPDQRRSGSTISLSLSRRLAAVTDDFGRISVIDIQKSLVIRMLKGYRDAECGWVTVSGDWNGKTREVPFLIVHAPKRNILEVWLPQLGPRIAAFNVQKDAKLIFTPHTYLGTKTQRSRSFSSMSVVLLNPDGTMDRIVIPFHLALSGKTSKQSNDLHLLKTLKCSLRCEPEDQIVKILKEIHTTNVKLQSLNQVVSNRYATESLVENVIQLYRIHEDESRQNEMDHESRILMQQLNRLRQLTQFYRTINSIFDVDEKSTDSDITEILSSQLMLSTHDSSLIMKSLKDEELQATKSKQVSFTNAVMSYSSFLHCWEITTFDREVSSSIVPISINKKLSIEKKISLAHLLFGWSYHPSTAEKWRKAILDSGLIPLEVLQLTFVNWLELTTISASDVVNLSHTMLVLSILHQPDIECDPSLLNPYWDRVRGEVNEWTKPFHAFIVAHICKGIEASFNSLPSSESEELEESNAIKNPLDIISRVIELRKTESRIQDFEELSLELVEWQVLINRCNKLLSLQILFNAITLTGAEIQPDYSIRVMIEKGRGHVSELVAKWLIELEVPPAELLSLIQNLEPKVVDPNTDEDGEAQRFETVDLDSQDKPSDVMEHSDIKVKKIKECLKRVQTNFPQSMIEDVLKLNLVWEFGAAWKKSPSKVEKLEASVFFLIQIENAYCKHGVGCLMWENFVQSRVQNCVKLIDKSQGPPRDSYNSCDLGVKLLPRVFKAIKDLLECIIHAETRISYKAINRLKLESDDFWRDIRCSLPLMEVSMAQQITSSDLTYIHHQLLCVLSLIVTHQVTNIRPMSVFPERDRASFFKPLVTSWKSTSIESRAVVHCQQLNFLNRVITCIVIALPDISAFDKNACLLEPPSVSECVELGRSWGLAVDALRRHYISELYSSGLDSMAEYDLMKINDGVMMASQMIQIGGQRLKYLMTASKNALLIIPFVTPTVKDWCMALNVNALRYPDVPIRSTVSMVYKATTLLRETSPNYKLAQRLLKALQMIRDSNVLNK